jgi:lysozyme family protein
MRFTTSRIPEFDSSSKKLVAARAKPRYQKISQAVWGTEKWWGVVGVIHLREGGGNFTTYLGNGQSLSRVTTLVPNGRGPFLNHPNDPPGEDAFYRGALDALIDVQGANHWDMSSVGAILTNTEQTNGFGYFNKGLASPYVWGGTNQQQRGKYVSDGVFDPNAFDIQLGTAGLLRYMTGLDASCGFPDPTSIPVIVSPPIVPAPIPTPTPGEPPVTTPTPTPVPAPAPAVPVSIDLSGVLGTLVQQVGPKLVTALLPSLLPALPGIVAELVPGLAPLTPVINAGVSIVTQGLSAGGLQTITAKIIADAMYAEAIKIDPTLPHTT